MVLLSTTEGEDEPLKYPTIFNGADVAAITRMNLAAAAEFDMAVARRNIHGVRPGMHVLEVSSKTGYGMEEAVDFLQAQMEESRAAALQNTL